MQTVIFHNPRCSKSRETLGLIRAAGIEPIIVDYLDNPPAVRHLGELIREAGLSVRAMLRTDGAEFRQLGLDDPALTDDALLEAMVAHPALIERPLVSTPRGVRLCRPPERVLEILPPARPL